MKTEHKRAIVALVAMALVIAVGMSQGCTAANKQLATVEDSIHGSIARLDDLEKDFCTKNPSLKQQCDDLNPLIVTLLKAGDAVNRAVSQQRAADLAALAKAGSAVADALQKLPSSATGEMFKELFKALGAASTKTQ